MKIQDEAQLLGALVRDRAGRRLGRIVAVSCDQDPYTARWLVIAGGGWRRGLRAVPAAGAGLHPAGGFTLLFRRADVVRSPRVASASIPMGSVMAQIESYYAMLPT